MVLLRAIHIIGAVFWAGGTFLLGMYHDYVLDPGDPERTIQRLAAYDTMSKKVGGSGIVSVIAGLILYWFVSGGLNPSWILSTYGAVITVGAAAGIASFAVAIPMIGLTNDRAVELFDEVRHQDELTDDQAETVTRLRARLKKGERWHGLFLAIAVLAMATAQYL